MISHASATSISATSDEFLETFLPGSSAAVTRLRADISQLNSPRKRELIPLVLVLGESGTGKNHLVKVVSGHRQWLIERSSKEVPAIEGALNAYSGRFHEIHLPALPDQLIESELFGYVKGAFTGAVRDKPGLLAGDDVDEILLDEIGDISLALQAKLLGVLESGSFRPVGGTLNDQDSVNARLFMATNRSLEQLVAEGKFREDLYHRARLLVLHVPPLRQQPENIESIARRIEVEIRALLGVNLDAAAVDPTLTEADIDWARGYGWPGNVRELKLAITRWFFHDGRRCLRQVVEELQQPGITVATSSCTAAGSIASMVTSRLNTALAQSEPVATTLNELVDGYGREVKTATAAWYQTAQPSANQLMRLFPGHTSVGSIRNKLSSWRAR